MLSVPGRRIIKSLEAATMLFGTLRSARNERLQVAHLDRGNRLVGLQLRFGGIEPTVDFPIRAIVAEALRLHSAALILAHNHPSGDASPTTMDIDMTRRLAQAVRPLGIEIRDHLIFAKDVVTSFRRLGLL